MEIWICVWNLLIFKCGKKKFQSLRGKQCTETGSWIWFSETQLAIFDLQQWLSQISSVYIIEGFKPFLWLKYKLKFDSRGSRAFLMCLISSSCQEPELLLQFPFNVTIPGALRYRLVFYQFRSHSWAALPTSPSSPWLGSHFNLLPTHPSFCFWCNTVTNSMVKVHLLSNHAHLLPLGMISTKPNTTNKCLA